MKYKKLNYIFHNPNTIDVTAKYLLDIFMESNIEKVEKAIKALNELAEKERRNIMDPPT